MSTVTKEGWTAEWTEATARQVRHWVDEHRVELHRRLSSVERVLAMKAYVTPSPARTELEQKRALVILELGVLETLWKCHERWRLARDGMHVALDGPCLIVEYESGPMNEVAQEIVADAPRGAHINFGDVTPIFDKMLETYEGA